MKDLQEYIIENKDFQQSFNEGINTKDNFIFEVENVKEKILNDLKNKRFCKYSNKKDILTFSTVAMTLAYYGFGDHIIRNKHCFLDDDHNSIDIPDKFDYDDEFTDEDIDNMKFNHVPY